MTSVKPLTDFGPFPQVICLLFFSGKRTLDSKCCFCFCHFHFMILIPRYISCTNFGAISAVIATDLACFPSALTQNAKRKQRSHFFPQPSFPSFSEFLPDFSPALLSPSAPYFDIKTRQVQEEKAMRQQSTHTTEFPP